jgi:hypothetical protein
MKKYSERYGSPYDRGSADAYYGRPCHPHYYVRAPFRSRIVEKDDMSDVEIEAYLAGYESVDFNSVKNLYE